MSKASKIPTTLRVMAEYSSSGIWAVEAAGGFRHSMIEHSTLGLPKTLSTRFDRWIDQYMQRVETPEDFDQASVVAEGRALARELKHFLGGDVRVLYSSEHNVRVDEEIEL